MADNTPNNDPALPPAKKPTKLAQPYFTTKQGQSTLTGASLAELAIRIKASTPNLSYNDARKQAKDLQQAQSTITTGGGGMLANAKLGLLRKTLGQNLGTQLSRALTTSKSQDKAAQTLINFDGGKAERVKNEESENTIKALQDQVDKLTKAVKNNTAIRVDNQNKPVKVERKVKEDLSDAVAALKALGFDMKDIKERLSTLPKGLSTENQIKHALKPTAERIKSSEIKAVVEQTIKTELKQTGVDARTGKPRVRAVEAPKITPTVPSAVTEPIVEPTKPNMALNDHIDKLFQQSNDQTAKPISNVTAVRTPIKADDIVNEENKDKDESDNKDEKKKQEAKQSSIIEKLKSIQKGVNDIHSESFVGLLVIAIGALLVPLVRKIIDGVEWIHQKLQPVFDMITNIWDKYFSNDVKSLSHKISQVYIDANEQAIKAEREGDPNKALQIREAATHKIDQMKDDEDTNENVRKQGIATTPEEAIKQGKRTYLHQQDGQSISSRVTAEDYQNAGVDAPADLTKKKGPVQKLEPVKPATSATKKSADDLDKATQEKADTASPTASTIVIPMPMRETQVAVPVGSSGGDSALAVLAARNDDPTTQSYIGALFDHPAVYGPLGRA